MSISTRLGMARACAAALFVSAFAGCVATGYDAGPGAAVSVGYGVDYYEPYGGYDYGGWGWGHGYRVGPPRGGDHRPEHGPGPAPRAYHSAPASRPMPSIPNHARGGGPHR